MLVLLPGGTFVMGTEHDTPGARPDERPVRTVELSPFLVAKHELTQGQWLRATGTNPSYGGSLEELEEASPPDPARLARPVERVDWDDARRVLARFGLTLPSEARWEYAARGGRDSAVWWHAPADEGRRTWREHANLRSTAPGRTVPVGSLSPNPFGLHDVLGNVWEWCLDGYVADAYTRWPNPEPDPSVPPLGAETRVSRGGSYRTAPGTIRATLRGADPPTNTAAALGVRACVPLWN